MTKQLYKVRWYGPDGSTTASVDFYAADDIAARKQVKKLDRTRSLFTLYCGNRSV